jgi:Uma2 family endonuclease
MTLQTRSDDTSPHPGKLTARDFWLLADSGAFSGNARTELIEGEIWVVNSVHRWHARVMGEVNFRLREAITAAGLDLEVLIAGSVSMSANSVPEPDLSVIAPLHSDAKTIENDELKLAVEITDTTEDHDLRRKALLYARHAVPEYWVIHRDRRAVVQMWSPAEDGYRDRQEVPFGTAVASVTLPAIRMDTDSL